MGKKRIKLLDGSQPAEAKKKPRIKSGKADEARLADMGQKALAELEAREAREKETSVRSISSESSVLPEKHPQAGIPSVKPKPTKVRSQRYQNIKKNIASDKKYSPAEAVELAIKNANAGFDESLDIHLVLHDKLTASVSLPYGKAKQQKVAVADDKLIESISNNKVDFDVLIASPAMMSKLAKVAKILGPKGLMPNPKNGTISEKPEELKKKLESSRLAGFKTEAKAPLIHFSLGKVSIGPEKLLANLKAFLDAVKKTNIVKAVLCSTMGPGVKLDLESFMSFR